MLLNKLHQPYKDSHQEEKIVIKCRHHNSRVFNNSDINASELLENLEEMYSGFYMNVLEISLGEFLKIQIRTKYSSVMTC